jgi:hypothetical protein
VQSGLNSIIGMGGKNRDIVQSKLIWHHSPLRAKDTVQFRLTTNLEENRRFAKTIDEAATVMPSTRATRIHTPATLQIRYSRGVEIRSGQFSTVYKAVNLDTGRLIAVKIIRRCATKSAPEWIVSKHEVEILSRICHVREPVPNPKTNRN